MKVTEQLEKEVTEYNDLHNQIQAGEAQLAEMKENKTRRLGRIQLLQEMRDLESDSNSEFSELESGFESENKIKPSF